MLPWGAGPVCGCAGDFISGQTAGPLGTSVFFCACACVPMVPLIKTASTTNLTNITHVQSQHQDQLPLRLVVPNCYPEENAWLRCRRTILERRVLSALDSTVKRRCGGGDGQITSVPRFNAPKCDLIRACSGERTMRVALYLERARACSELADQAPANDKKAILQIAEAWLKLADAAAKEKEKQNAGPPGDKPK